MDKKDLVVGREYLIEILQGNELTVEFTKKNGEKRKMKCTLKPNALPKREVTEDADKEPNLDIISVWDLEKDAWRSFRVESVTAFSFSL